MGYSKFQFKDEVEKQQLIDEHSDLYIVEMQYLFEGNFIIFSDAPLEKKVVYTQVPQEEWENQKAIIDAMLGVVE